MTSLMVSMMAFVAGVKDRFTREENGATQAVARQLGMFRSRPGWRCPR
jgi:hypothetical protein